MPLVILLALLAVALHLGAAEPDVIAVDLRVTIAPVEPRTIGINVNYLLDDDHNRPQARPLVEALREMGVKSLRYPGGGKSQANLWSTPPFARAQPVLARIGKDEWPSNDRTLVREDLETFKIDPLDFDEFIALSRELHAEPICVVCFDAMYKPAKEGGRSPTREQLLDTAVAWVRYAKDKGCGVAYWEIGNESYMDAYNGAALAADYGRDLAEFAAAMKAVDPGIRIIANGPNRAEDIGARDRAAGNHDPWWKTVLGLAGPSIDLVAVHTYPCWTWGSYDHYRAHDPDLGTDVDHMRAAVAKWAAPADAQRIRVAVTEANAADWSKGDGAWPNRQDLGHALVVFDLFGRLLERRVDCAQLWNTRWMKNATAPELWDALDQDNALLPTGRALAIWSTFLHAGLVRADGTQAVRAWASAGKDGWSVFLLNKDTAPHTAALAIAGASGSAELWRFAGTGPQDGSPTWGRAGQVDIADGKASIELPPTSITVLDSGR